MHYSIDLSTLIKVLDNDSNVDRMLSRIEYFCQSENRCICIFEITHEKTTMR